MLIKNKTFSGGYSFCNFEGKPQEELIDLGIPEKVIIPLKQGFGNEVPPLVKIGEKVNAGQIIARDDNSVSSPIHSSVNGTVEEIKKVNYFKQEINTITIKSDKTSDWQPLEGHTSDWTKLPVEKIEELLYLSGVSSLDREGIPTHYKSSIIPPEDVENVIVHGVGSEAYNLSLSVLLDGKKTFNFVKGLKILKKLMPDARFHLAFNKYDENLIERISGFLSGEEWIKFYGLEPRFPQGYDEVLTPTLLGKRFPYGYSAASIGVVVLNMQAVLQVYEAVSEGKPLIERTVALCGQGFKENPHIKVRIGTPLEYIVAGRTLENEDLRFILNSPLTGANLSNLLLPIDRTFSHIISFPERKSREFLAFIRPGCQKDSYSRTFLSSLFGSKKKVDTNLNGEKRPCIFCNFCQEVCPVSIIPHLIYHYVDKNIIDKTLLNSGIFNCIECNLCNYVCPSKIQVAQYIRDGQEKLITMGYDRSMCITPYFDLKGLEEYKGIK